MKLNNRKCPNPECNYIFEDFTNLQDERLKPKEGDVSFCIKCGSVSLFGKDKMIPIDETKLDEATQMEIARIRRAWKSQFLKSFDDTMEEIKEDAEEFHKKLDTCEYRFVRADGRILCLKHKKLYTLNNICRDCEELI